ncbi:MAG TPA: MerR family transcriptional regulator, partial [Novosphingobium sp.]|nr:MerR family transcriptional regulator [Novosphingobium sp.]
MSGIQDVAAQLGVSHRTLRFYEDKGLIEPARVGNTRIYARRDIARMQLILRGKRLGFSIREIKDF